MTAAPLDPLAVVGWSCIALGTFYAWLLYYLRPRKWVLIPLLLIGFIVIQLAMQAAK